MSPSMSNVNNNINNVSNLNQTSANLNNNQQPQQQQVPLVNNNNVDDLRAEERDDDWLSILHNFCSFLVLFSIVYFYSTLTRFIMVLFVVLLLMLYVLIK